MSEPIPLLGNLILYTNLLCVEWLVSRQAGSIQIDPVHMNSCNLVIIIRRIIINAFLRIAA